MQGITSSNMTIPCNILIKCVSISIELNPENICSHSYKLNREESVTKQKGKMGRSSDLNPLRLIVFLIKFYKMRNFVNTLLGPLPELPRSPWKQGLRSTSFLTFMINLLLKHSFQNKRRNSGKTKFEFFRFCLETVSS